MAYSCYSSLKSLLDSQDFISFVYNNEDGSDIKKPKHDAEGELFSQSSVILNENIWGSGDGCLFDDVDLTSFLDDELSTNKIQDLVNKSVAESPPSDEPLHHKESALCSKLHTGMSSLEALLTAEDRDLPDIEVDFKVQEEQICLATVPGQTHFNPRKRHFEMEELRPLPLLKKSKKVSVPENLKDSRYWNRRTKNNVSAKRSREIRRIKENQISMRAAFLEKENDALKLELSKALKEIELLKKLDK